VVLTAFYVIMGLAAVTMLVGLGMAIDLLKVARGGKIGRVVRILLVLIVGFTGGYAVAPFMPSLPREVGLILVAVVYLLGAAFVVLVLSLIRSLIKKVFAELNV